MPKIIVSGKTKHKCSKEDKELREQYTPSYKTCELKCPGFLSDDEKTKWDDLILIIKEIKNYAVTDADIDLLIIAVKSWCEFIRMDKLIIAKPDLYVLLPKPNKDNIIVYSHVKNPCYYQRRIASEKYMECLSKLGIDPIGRARIGLARVNFEKEDNTATITRLLNRKGDND